MAREMKPGPFKEEFDAIKERLSVLEKAYVTGEPLNERDTEVVAEKVYDAMRAAADYRTPDWVPNGNSLMQDKARSVARAITGTSGQQYETVATPVPAEPPLLPDPENRVERIIDTIQEQMTGSNAITLSQRDLIKRGIRKAINEFYLGANYCIVTDTIQTQNERIADLMREVDALTEQLAEEKGRRETAEARLQNVALCLG